MERHRILPPTPCLPYRPHPPIKTRVGKKGGDTKFDSTTRDAMESALNDALSHASRRGVNLSKTAGTGRARWQVLAPASHPGETPSHNNTSVWLGGGEAKQVGGFHLRRDTVGYPSRMARQRKEGRGWLTGGQGAVHQPLRAFW